MASFNISKGLEASLPSTKTDGKMYFCTDTGNIYIDYKDGNNILRKLVNKQILDAKQDAITGAASTIANSNLTANRALISNGLGKIAASAITNVELGYLDGVTSNIQTQLDNKLSKSGGIMTGNIIFTTNGINYAAGEQDVSMFKVYDTNGGYGYRLQYNGSGTGNDNTLVLVSDNQNNAEINAVTMYQDGTTTFAKNITASGGITGNLSGNATSATKATQDASGNVITSTYATKTELDTGLAGKAASSHNHAASTITSGTLSSDRLPTVPIAKGGTGATTAAAALTNLGITATAAELNKMDGVTASTTELNYVDGVTSNIQTQLDGKLAKTAGYAGSSSAGGSATSAVKLDSSAGSATQPVYFSGGKPVATTYTLGKSVPSDAKFTDTTYSVATTSAAGLMSASDKSKLDGITSGANKITVDTALSSTSTNPVQNKVINSALDGKLPLSGGRMTGTISFGVGSYGGHAIGTNFANSDGKVVGGAGVLASNGTISSYHITLGTTDWWYSGAGLSITAGDITWKNNSLIHSGNISSQSVNYATSAGSATSATSATKATQDASGNTITSTYATKTELTNGLTNKVTTVILTAEDLNTIVTSGFYRLSGDNPNMPPYCYYGQLIVSRGADTITQIASSYSTGRLYTRSGNPSDISGHGSWTDWHEIITSSTIGSQSVNYANSAGSASYATYDSSGNTIASTYATKTELTNGLSSKAASSHTHISLKGNTDNRDVATTPNDYNGEFKVAGLKYNNIIGSPSSDTYSGVVGFRQWSDNSGGNAHELAFNDSGLFMRSGASTAWGSWEKFITSANIGSQSVNYATSAGSVAWGGISGKPSSFTPSTHNQAASTITTGTFGGQVKANATAAATIGTAQVRDIYAGTSDMTAGSSALTSGTIYLVYE